jgi:hypothetical protein
MQTANMTSFAAQEALPHSKHCFPYHQVVKGKSRIGIQSRATLNIIDNSTIGCPDGDNTSTAPPQEPLQKRSKTKLLSGSCSFACCSWQGLYKDLSKHLNNDCDFTVCDCPLQSCLEKVMRKYLSDHLRVCPHRTVTCKHRCCGVEYLALAAESHEEVCPELDIVCTNIEVRNGKIVDVCKQKYKRKDAALHESICKLAKVDCVYAPLGCKVTFLRKDINQHLVDKALSHNAMSKFELTTKLSNSKEKVTWQVDWPLQVGRYYLDPKKFIIGKYRCWMKVSVDEISGDLIIYIYAVAVLGFESDFLFPASINGSSLTVLHPSDDQKSVKNYFADGDVINCNESGLGYTTMVIAADVLDYEADGMFTIKAEIQIAPSTERASLNEDHCKH